MLHTLLLARKGSSFAVMERLLVGYIFGQKCAEKSTQTVRSGGQRKGVQRVLPTPPSSMRNMYVARLVICQVFESRPVSE